jgi:hypothetical protein
MAAACLISAIRFACSSRVRSGRLMVTMTMLFLPCSVLLDVYALRPDRYSATGLLRFLNIQCKKNSVGFVLVLCLIARMPSGFLLLSTVFFHSVFDITSTKTYP